MVTRVNIINLRLQYAVIHPILLGMLESRKALFGHQKESCLLRSRKGFNFHVLDISNLCYVPERIKNLECRPQTCKYIDIIKTCFIKVTAV